MKIGNFDAVCGKYGKEKYLKMKELGYETVDFGIADTDVQLYKASEEEFKKILSDEKKLMDEAGIEITQVHGPWRWPTRDNLPEDRAERFEKMKKAIDASSLLGCKHMVIHPISPYGTEDTKEGKEKETWEINLAFFKELVKYAKTKDVIICLENMPWKYFSIATPQKIYEFVKAIDDDNFKICFDTGHAVCTASNAAEAVRLFGKDLRVLHCHDNYGGDSHLMPFLGFMKWDEFYNALVEIGYEGSFSLECAPPASKLSPELYDYLNKAYIAAAKQIVGR